MIDETAERQKWYFRLTVTAWHPMPPNSRLESNGVLPPKSVSRISPAGKGESDAFKPLLIDTRDFDDFLSNTKPKFSQFFRELAAVNQVDWRCAVPRGFLDGGGSERARRNEETLIGSTYHRATEIANIAG